MGYLLRRVIQGGTQSLGGSSGDVLLADPSQPRSIAGRTSACTGAEGADAERAERAAGAAPLDEGVRDRVFGHLLDTELTGIWRVIDVNDSVDFNRHIEREFTVISSAAGESSTAA